MKDRHFRGARYGWVVMGLFWSLNAVSFSLVQSLGILLPSMSRDLALSPIDSGWLGSSYFLILCLTSVLLSFWLSRYEPIYMVILSSFISSILIFAQGWAPNFTVALATRVVFVLMIVARMPAGVLLIQRWFPPQHFPWVNAVAMITMDASLAVAMTTLPLIMNLLQGWRNTYYALGFLSILISLAWLVLGRRQPKLEYTRAMVAKEGSSLGTIFKYKEIWFLGIALFGASAAGSGFFTFWPTFVSEAHNVPLTSAGFILGLGPLGAIAGYLVYGLFVVRFGKRKLLLVIAGLALSLLSFAILNTSSTPVLAVLFFVRGFTWMFLPFVMTVPYELPNIKPKEVTVATAMVMTLMAAGGASGPLITGFMVNSFGSLYIALTSICILPITLSIAGFLLPKTGTEPRKTVSTP